MHTIASSIIYYEHTFLKSYFCKSIVRMLSSYRKVLLFCFSLKWLDFFYYAGEWPFIFLFSIRYYIRYFYKQVFTNTIAITHSLFRLAYVLLKLFIAIMNISLILFFIVYNLLIKWALIQSSVSLNQKSLIFYLILLYYIKINKL